MIGYTGEKNEAKNNQLDSRDLFEALFLQELPGG
jgi:hypothetical protein